MTEGPQAAPAYFTPADLDQFYRADWTVQSHANRTGIRLSGPKPAWSRPDGGEAGLHPSNLHDNPYSVGSLNVSGDTHFARSRRPSLGGYRLPAHRHLGRPLETRQIRPGDTVRFAPVTDARGRRAANRAPGVRRPSEWRSDGGRLAVTEASQDRPSVAYLRGGDDNVLVEYGDMVLDLGLRMRVHALSAALSATTTSGIVDITPGVRSLHIHLDPDVFSPARLVGLLRELEQDLPGMHDLAVPSRTIQLPLSFDDPSIAEAISRYRSGVRDTAPWLPSNTEFIRRINGLDSVADVADTIFRAEYLVLGLGDVYLGAPLAVPLDPRHRLVTTKYNPARTWTPSDAVGIGGKYLCVYGMASPGGYQLIGRTIPIWSGYRQTGAFEAGKPWLFRFFDGISWDPVSPEQLAEARAEARAGRFHAEVGDATFVLADHLAFQADNAVHRRFQRPPKWGVPNRIPRLAGRGRVRPGRCPPPPPAALEHEVPDGATVIEAPMAGNVWRMQVEAGDRVEAGSTAVILEAMKLEMPVTTPVSGTVLHVLAGPGDAVTRGHRAAVVAP